MGRYWIPQDHNKNGKIENGRPEFWKGVVMDITMCLGICLIGNRTLPNCK